MCVILSAGPTCKSARMAGTVITVTSLSPGPQLTFLTSRAWVSWAWELGTGPGALTEGRMERGPWLGEDLSSVWGMSGDQMQAYPQESLKSSGGLSGRYHKGWTYWVPQKGFLW